MQVTLDNRTINISQIWVTVTCLECKNTYQIQISRPRQMKNCRCTKGTHILITSVRPGVVDVRSQFIDRNGRTIDNEPDAIEIED